MEFTLKIINSILINNLVKNHHLVYALLYQQHILFNFSSTQRNVDSMLMKNIQLVLSHFNSALQSRTLLEDSAEDLFEIIKRTSIQWNNNNLKVRNKLYELICSIITY